ncbi:hypothetical protein BC937DRAFT_87986 [Endogone sp. FLAS-F59071]|nr:hypothetical protein BC937DRAFT_87986 [Endogone sp. FLAS-F59071]|eukprot:RUS19114.1 hypothetical protein BC937DRAFT_87986 [Endogone sp. FLAS-F59071]
MDTILRWHNPPPSHTYDQSRDVHTIRATPSSGFWRTTTERRDTGNFFHQPGVRGNFRVQCFIKGTWVHEYDQAGLMVRVVEGEEGGKNERWIKTGIELMGRVQYVR